MSNFVDPSDQSLCPSLNVSSTQQRQKKEQQQQQQTKLNDGIDNILSYQNYYKEKISRKVYNTDDNKDNKNTSMDIDDYKLFASRYANARNNDTNSTDVILSRSRD